MKRFLTALLLGSLIFVSPAVVSAAETTYESEEGQAMIKPPLLLNRHLKVQMKPLSHRKRERSVPPALLTAWTGLLPTQRTALLPLRVILQSASMQDIRDPG